MTVSLASTPRFAPGYKFKLDKVRGAWVVLGPERLFAPDEIAAEILKLVDGQRSVADIVALLAERFTAAPEEIAADVAPMLQDLSDKGVIET